jgi:peptide/nickel transport system substrate-binding protein
MFKGIVRGLTVVVLLTLGLGNLVVSGQGATTEVGTPRNQTLIMDALDGRIANPKQMNPYLQGTSAWNEGLNQLAFSAMWEINTATGKLFPALAEKMPEPLNKEYTDFKITLRQGMAWSDGVEITADDLAYTIDMLMKNKGFPASGVMIDLVKSFKVLDKYTLELQTNKSQPRLASLLGVTIWGNRTLNLVPKHIFEKQADPTKFDYYPPVTSGPYTVKDVDPNGNWFLWEKRADWAKTDVGMIAGEPGPQYILFRFYGPEEKRIIAGTQHNLDVYDDITPESWDILRAQVPTMKAWLNSFPWADMDDPCERGIELLTNKPPFDKKEVRWALALATNISDVSLATFGGALRVSVLPVPPITVLQNAYHKPMRDWLTAFTLPDGFKPYNPDFGTEFAKKMIDQGVEGIPTDPAAQLDLFGMGWWKYDLDEATKLLTSVGFKQDASKKWLNPDGTPFEITINAPANFEVQSGRLAFAVADSWRKFGLAVNVQQLESGPFWNADSNGNFNAGSYWPGCGTIPDVYYFLDGTWNRKYIVPSGQPAPGNRPRFDHKGISDLIDGLAPFTFDDPKIVPMTQEVMKAWVAEMPWIPMFGTSKFVPVDTYYWSGFPTSDNFYEGPWWWWSLFKYMTPKFKPTGK